MSKQIQKELETIKKQTERYANRNANKLMAAYSRALNDIRKEIGLIYANYSVDGVLDISRSERVKVLNAMERKLVQHARELNKLDTEITTNILKNVGMDAGLKTAYTLEKGLDTVVNLNFLNPTFIEKAIFNKVEGKDFSDRIWDNKKLLVTRVKRDVEKAIINGHPLDKLARQIKKDFGSSAFESKRLIQNEVKNVQIDAQEEIYSESNVVQKVMWLATLDENTRDEHQEYDGQMWDINEPHPSPKDYVMCRCTLVPVIEGWTPTRRKENVVDESGTKQVIDYSNYKSWLKSRGVE